MSRKRTVTWAAGLALIAGAAVPLSAAELPPNDYPTVGRADYVYACMQANGPTRQVLEKCSCSIDKIAELLSWDEYTEAETIMSIGVRGGDSASLFNSPQLLKKVHTLKLAQVEAELRCF
ncbi:MAG: hypothetical protein ABL893_07710 [Hyphomicrobium sp.]|nr:hypothetical protein [Hyphomicrobium sp.]